MLTAILAVAFSMSLLALVFVWDQQRRRKEKRAH